MKKTKQLKKIEPSNIVTLEAGQAISPVQAAMQSGASPAELLQFMQLQERYDANEAKKSYSMAVAEFKKEKIYIPKDKTNTQFDSKYSSKTALVSAVNPYLSNHGLSASWDLDVGQIITVTCILSHKDGHSESVSMPAPADKSGKKNPIQEMKSTITYLEIITYEAVTGVSSSEGSKDDDGNAAGQFERITEDQELELHAMLSEAEMDADKFERYASRTIGAAGFADIRADQYDYVVKLAKAAIKMKGDNGGIFEG